MQTGSGTPSSSSSPPVWDPESSFAPPFQSRPRYSSIPPLSPSKPSNPNHWKSTSALRPMPRPAGNPSRSASLHKQQARRRSQQQGGVARQPSPLAFYSITSENLPNGDDEDDEAIEGEDAVVGVGLKGHRAKSSIAHVPVSMPHPPPPPPPPKEKRAEVAWAIQMSRMDEEGSSPDSPNNAVRENGTWAKTIPGDGGNECESGEASFTYPITTRQLQDQFKTGRLAQYQGERLRKPRYTKSVSPADIRDLSTMPPAITDEASLPPTPPSPSTKPLKLYPKVVRASPSYYDSPTVPIKEPKPISIINIKHLTDVPPISPFSDEQHLCLCIPADSPLFSNPVTSTIEHLRTARSTPNTLIRNNCFSAVYLPPPIPNYANRRSDFYGPDGLGGGQGGPPLRRRVVGLPGTNTKRTIPVNAKPLNPTPVNPTDYGKGGRPGWDS